MENDWRYNIMSSDNSLLRVRGWTTSLWLDLELLLKPSSPETFNVEENQRLRMSRYQRCSCKWFKDNCLVPWCWGHEDPGGRSSLPMNDRAVDDEEVFGPPSALPLPALRLTPCWSVFATWPLLPLFYGGLILESVNRTVRGFECCRKWEHMQVWEEGKQLTPRYFERDMVIAAS